MRHHRSPLPALAVALGGLLAGCGDGGSFVVAVPDSREGAALAALYVALLEGNGIEAETGPRLGSTEDLLDAVVTGEANAYPAYSGVALDALAGAGSATPDVDVTASALRREVEARGAQVFDPAVASRPLVLVTTYDTWDRTGVYEVSGLAALEEEVTLAVPPGCGSAPACLPGLEEAYGLEPTEVVEIGPVEERLAAVRRGEVLAAVVPATTGELSGTLDVVLVDDRRQQPAQSLVPVVRDEDDERREQAYRAFDRMTEELTTPDLRELLRRVDEGEEAADVAGDLLADKGLVDR